MAAGVCDLTLLATVKKHLGIPDTDTTADALLQTYITAVSKFFETRCRRVFRNLPYVDTFDGNGFTAYTVKESPVASVTSVTIDGEPIPARITVDGSGWVLNGARVELADYRFNVGVMNCVVSYSAGFGPIPEDLEQACRMLVVDLWRSRGREGIASRTTNSGESTTYRPDSLPNFVELVLSAYTQVLV